MTFSGRIRLFLVAIALLPPLLMMAVVYFYSTRQQELAYQQDASEDLRKLVTYREHFRSQLRLSLKRVLTSDQLQQIRFTSDASVANDLSVDARQFDLDFLEILDSTNRVLATFHRPGLVGEKISWGVAALPDSGVTLRETVEYDIDGRHTSLAGLAVGNGGLRVYGGKYFESQFQPMAGLIMRGTLSVVYADESRPEFEQLAAMEFGALYQPAEHFLAVLGGNRTTGFVLVADFEPTDTSSVFASFINVISLVALIAIVAAIALGIYISGRAKREIDNLVEAFSRVAGGNLDTTVMAFEEGEFSQLADSFSEMTHKLRESQSQLATSEKIAAWQTMARKIAHEIKNPLTPIAISADDLRRSFQEKLPRFEDTLDSNTRMIKSEVERLSALLDQFVGFARMSPPEIVETPMAELLRDFETLYADKLRDGKLVVRIESQRKNMKVDPRQMRQLLVNLVKNGFEADENASVRVSLYDNRDGFRLTIIDTGPGFATEILDQSFEPYVSTKKGGSGLGLVICQRIVHDHGGSIQLHNIPEGGAAVTILLPQN